MTHGDETWLLTYEGFNPAEEGLRETLCTLGNGYFAARGAGSEVSAGACHYPAVYLAGGYNRLKTEIAGTTIEHEDLVNLPNAFRLTFRIPGEDWLNLESAKLLEYRQQLDMRRGLLTRRVRFSDEKGRIFVWSNRRLVHQKWPHLAAQEVSLVAENWTGEVEFESALDGRVINAGVKRYRELNSAHLLPLANLRAGDLVGLRMKTSQSDIVVVEVMRNRVFLDGEPFAPEVAVREEPGWVAQRFRVALSPGLEVRVEKTLSLRTSRDRVMSECGEAALLDVKRAANFEQLVEHQSRAWWNLWERFYIDVKGEDDTETVRILRLHLFHLLQTVSAHSLDLDVGVPARGWHGEAYRGHIFWDELFIMPLLNFHFPELSRALLRYRYRRLEEARAAAVSAGFTGAMYPWQSGSSGREESQKMHLNPRSGRWLPDHSSLQRHVNLAIAYNTWQYYQATRDVEFMAFYGAEMIFEIARFFSGIASYNEELDRFEITGVMGPDEYHEDYPGQSGKGLKNNSYTNVLVVWTLCRALELLRIMPDDQRSAVCEKIDLTPAEVELWESISRKMRVVFHGDGIISQFEGYDQLAELDWEKYRSRYGDIMRMDRILEAEGSSANNYKLSKQADVLMLFYLFPEAEIEALFARLGYAFDQTMIRRNIEYYLGRTSHGSTLSQLVHSWVLARFDLERSWKFFTKVLESDVKDTQGGTTPEGIHLGAMAGAVDLTQRCYLGASLREDVLWFDPRLPQGMQQLNLRLLYRGQLLEVCCDHRLLTVCALRNGWAPQVRVGCRGAVSVVQSGGKIEFAL
ncbi:MAG: glycoside hydrolase family 65 protein [Deltaproteobacteria bacterium]|nr:glycoside hydrolase family 65 protein [Deltaproteobacteria bacterium]